MVRPRAGGAPQVRLQDRRAQGHRYVFEADGLPPAVNQHGMAAGGAHVSHPVHTLAEHRHQVPLAIDDGHDHRERHGSSRTTAAHLERHQVVTRDAAGEEPGP